MINQERANINNPVTVNTGYLTDSVGVKSSKRLWGSILLTIGIVTGLILFGYGLYNPNALFTSSYNVMELFIFFGSGLLGIGVLENIGVKRMAKE